MWQKKESKLELAASMIRHVMPVFHEKKNVIILCDSWYVKKNLVSIIDEYENLDMIGNAGLILSFMTCRRSAPEKEGGRRLFFSTVFPEQLQIFCAWQEKSLLNQTGSIRMQFIPLMLYAFRWPIEVSYYEQKTFGHCAVTWSAAAEGLKCWSI